MKKTVKILITGLVQGVFFRSFVKEEADKIDIKGYVRNLGDGKVEVLAEGQNESIEKIIDICRKGGPYSKVNEIEVQELKNQNFKEFKILHL